MIEWMPSALQGLQKFRHNGAMNYALLRGAIIVVVCAAQPCRGAREKAGRAVLAVLLAVLPCRRIT